MNSLIRTLRESPLDFLPEVSLSQFFQFRQGYALRCKMEGISNSWGINFGRFGPWVRKKFGVPLGAIEIAEPVFLASSLDERDAFCKYFELLEEFSKIDQKEIEPPVELRDELTNADSPMQVFSDMERNSKYVWSHSDLLPRLPKKQKVPIYKSFREVIRPDSFPFYARTFLDLCAFINGDECAHTNLALRPDEARLGFREFQKWVEDKKSFGLRIRWFKAVLYHSEFRNCLSCPNGAFSRYCSWLNEFGKETGIVELFRVPQNGTREAP
jgi:hypothetical protein